MSYYFISDLHLSESRSDITLLFRQFLSSLKNDCKGLYILGDLFNYWIGDDDDSEWLIPIKRALKETTDKGIAVYFMPGNRDFAVGDRFCRETGICFLSDPSIIKLDEERVLLMHGDSLCTDDANYQRYRAVIQNRFVLGFLRNLPLNFRHKLARKLRSTSQKAQQNTAMHILDANVNAVSSTMDDWQVDMMIHGHTHRPHIHNNARSSVRGTRFVLGDWYTQGSFLEYSSDGFQLYNVPLPSV